MDIEDDAADYKAHANAIKDEANVCFQKGETMQAIELYTRAIDLDPDDPIFYSNRSAAYMKADMVNMTKPPL
jgi:serine/threonine-protein phosphatase 5